MGDPQVVQPERARIITEMADALRAQDFVGEWFIHGHMPSPEQIAEVCLSVIERPASESTDTGVKRCTCGNSGFPASSGYENHPHLSACPLFNQEAFQAWIEHGGKIKHNHVTTDIRELGKCVACDLYHSRQALEGGDA